MIASRPVVDRLKIAEAAQRVIDTARRYRDVDPETGHDKALFGLFDALENFDRIEVDLIAG